MKKAVIHYMGYLLSALGAVLGVSLLSHYVSPVDYGRVALYISLGTLFQYVVRESLGAAILRYTDQINRQKMVCAQLVQQSSARLTLVFVLVLAFSCVYLREAEIWEFLSGMVFMLLLGASVIGETFLSATGNRMAYAIHVTVQQWLRFLFAFLLFIFWQPTVLAIMTGFSVGFFAALVYDFYVFRHFKTDELVINDSLDTQNAFAGFTAIAIGFLVWFLTFYERIALEWFHGEASLGAYFVLFQIGFMPVYMFMQSAVTYFYPILFASGRADTQHLNVKNLSIVTAVVVLAFALLQLLHKWLFSWLVGPDYREYSWLLPWLFLAALINAISYLLQAYYYETHALKKLLHIKLIAALVAFVLVSVCVWQAGIQGLVFASVMVSLVLIVMSYRFIEK